MNGHETVTLEHFDRSQGHDQLAMLLQLQREESLHWHQGIRVLTRYADMNAGFRDTRLINRAPEPFRKDRPFVRAFREVINQNRDQYHKNWFSFADRPRHADPRRIMRAEMNRQMPDLRRLFQSIADELLDEIDGSDEQSLRKGFAETFPAMAAAELMGLPREKWRWFTESFGGSSGGDLSKRTNRMESLLSETLANPEALRPGMLTALSEGCRAGTPMSEKDLRPNCVLFSMAVFVNTRPVLEKIVGYLRRNPSEMERIRRDPSVLPAAVEEFIRCVSTTSYSSRVATADVEIRGGFLSVSRQPSPARSCRRPSRASRGDSAEWKSVVVHDADQTVRGDMMRERTGNSTTATAVIAAPVSHEVDDARPGECRDGY